MSEELTNDYDTNRLKSAMVHLADTVRLIHVIGTRIRNGLSTTQLPNPVLRDFDHIGSTSGSDHD